MARTGTQSSTDNQTQNLTIGVGPESVQRGNRKLRWASMFDAMRKAMKKREIAAAKINHRKSTAELQANQNVTEPKPNSDRIPTLQSFQDSNSKETKHYMKTISTSKLQEHAWCRQWLNQHHRHHHHQNP